MKIMMHVCCGPCFAYPLAAMRDEGLEPIGFFFNPNIHPFREFQKRLASLRDLSALMDVQLDFDPNYGLRDFLRQVVFHEDNRCRLCYYMRLLSTVKRAVKIRADAFSTTLLYSRYQKHELIKSLATRLADEYNIPFYYRDFRAGWQQGIEMAKDMELYRQPYCGCIYSEQERYDKNLRKMQSLKEGCQEINIGRVK